ncbi:MAG TPA: MmgE/PrpD family protein [Chitinophagaceae bacterium]|jgi:2-methylcitrate dehydratase
MEKELQTKQIARFALNTRFEDIGKENIDQLKRHLLDSLGSLLHATTKASVQKMVRQMEQLGEGGACKVPLLKSLPLDRAAQLFTALIRYPDFMDNYMGKESTCHPSDNIGSLLAAAQYKNSSGKDFLTAMAIAYQLECRLVEEIPVMMEGIDHTLLLSYSITAAVSRMFGLTEEQAAHALAMAGCSISPMVTSRAAYTYEWKGFASSFDALNCVNMVLLARQGMTGPIAIFEGPKGFKEVFHMKLDYDWSKETFELIHKCVLKSYNAEVHSQSALEAIMDLRKEKDFSATGIEKIDITTFLTCYHIIGSGAYGDRQDVATKEQADHSLFYLAAVAVLDGEVWPEQLLPERIRKSDVQELLRKVFVHTKFPLHKPLVIAGMLDPYTEAYPGKMKAKVDIQYTDGCKLSCSKDDYHGFYTRPFTWEDTTRKFNRLCRGIVKAEQQQQIIALVQDLENREIASLLKLICV